MLLFQNVNSSLAKICEILANSFLMSREMSHFLFHPHEWVFKSGCPFVITWEIKKIKKRLPHPRPTEFEFVGVLPVRVQLLKAF